MSSQNGMNPNHLHSKGFETSELTNLSHPIKTYTTTERGYLQVSQQEEVLSGYHIWIDVPLLLIYPHFDWYPSPHSEIIYYSSPIVLVTIAPLKWGVHSTHFTFSQFSEEITTRLIPRDLELNSPILEWEDFNGDNSTGEIGLIYTPKIWSEGVKST